METLRIGYRTENFSAFTEALCNLVKELDESGFIDALYQ